MFKHGMSQLFFMVLQSGHCWNMMFITVCLYSKYSSEHTDFHGINCILDTQKHCFDLILKQYFVFSGVAELLSALF